MYDYTGKTVVITGIAQGIGLSIAHSFKIAGALVAGMDITRPLESFDLFYQGDVGNQEDLEAFASQVQGRFPKVDVLVNNAMKTEGGLPDCGYEAFVKALRVGVAAPYYLCKLFLPILSPGASIINLSSTRAFSSQAGTESYTAAKGGITALTHALAVSLSGKARVNAIAPGWIDTTETDFIGPDANQHPAGRVGKPVDIANACLFLASQKAGFITGHTLVVDGGMSKLMVYHGDEGWAKTE